MAAVAAVLFAAVPCSRAESGVDWQTDSRLLQFKDFWRNKYYNFVNKDFQPRIGALCFSMFEKGDAPRLALNNKTLRTEKATVYPPYELGFFGPADSGKPRVSASGDWIHKKIAYEYPDDTTLTVWATRLAPAVMLHYDGAVLTLFGGPKPVLQQLKGTGRIFEVFGCYNHTQHGKATRQSPVTPKFMAVRDAVEGAIAFAADDAADYLADMADNWMLVWYGQDGCFYPSPMPHQAMQPFPAGDAPFLLLFENNPDAIEVREDGGLDFSFPVQAGHIQIMPFGHRHPAVTDMKDLIPDLAELRTPGPAMQVSGASSARKDFVSVPESVAKRCEWWEQRLREFPVSVEESYEFDENGDVVISERFEFIAARAGAEEQYRMCPVPPMLAVAVEEGLPVIFDAPFEQTDIYTYCGPYSVALGVSGYTWRAPALGKYVAERRAMGERIVQIPAGVEERLLKETGAVLDAGHLAPWVFSPYDFAVNIGRPLWSNPGDTLFHLLSLLDVLESSADVLPSATAKRLEEYVKRERGEFPPEDVIQMPYSAGARREKWNLHPGFAERMDDPEWFKFRTSYWKYVDPYVLLTRIPMENLYSLSEFYLGTGRLDELRGNWEQIREIPEPYLRELDWATMGMGAATHPLLSDDLGSYYNAFWPFAGGGAGMANRFIAGMIGLARMADMAGDGEQSVQARALALKWLCLRFAQEKFVKNLFRHKIFPRFESGNEISPDYPDERFPHELRREWRLTPEAMGVELAGGSFWPDQFEWGRNDAAKLEVFFMKVRDINEFQLTLHPAGSFGHCWSNPFVELDGMVPELGRFLKELCPDETIGWLKGITERKPDWFCAYIWTGDWQDRGEHTYFLPQNALSIFLGKAWIERESPERLALYANTPWTAVGDWFYMSKLAETIRACHETVWTEVRK